MGVVEIWLLCSSGRSWWCLLPFSRTAFRLRLHKRVYFISLRSMLQDVQCEYRNWHVLGGWLTYCTHDCHYHITKSDQTKIKSLRIKHTFPFNIMRNTGQYFIEFWALLHPVGIIALKRVNIFSQIMFRK